MADVTLPGAGGGPAVSFSLGDEVAAAVSSLIGELGPAEEQTGGLLDNTGAPRTVVYSGTGNGFGILQPNMTGPDADGNPTAVIVTRTGGTTAILGSGTGRDVVIADGGNLRYAAVFGSATVVSGAGNDTLTGNWDNAAVEFSTGAGDDSVLLPTAVGTVSTGAGNDILSVAAAASPTAGVLVADTGTGDDTVWLAGGNTILTTGEGNDKIDVRFSATGFIDAGEGDDTVALWGEGDFTVVAGAGSDFITARGFGGNHSIQVDGQDTVELGLGESTVAVSGTTAGAERAQILLFDGAALVTDASANADGEGAVVRGLGIGNLTFIGGAGASEVIVGNGSATITGGAGGGWFDGGLAGSNSITAGEGSTFLISRASGDTLEAAGAGADFLYASTGNVTLLGGASTGENVFWTRADAERGLLGNADASIVGGAGGERIFLGNGNATVDAGAGNDTIEFGRGAATVIGGEGADVFRFFFNDSAAFGQRAVVTIQDFALGEDFLELEGFNEGGVFGFATSGGDTVIGLDNGVQITLVGVELDDTAQLFRPSA